MTKLFTCIYMVILGSTISYSQSHPRVSVGVDLFSSLPVYFDKGYTLEPSVIYTVNDAYSLEFSFGTTSISKRHIYGNIDYKNNGFYFKLGGRRTISEKTFFGAAFGYTSFEESGDIDFGTVANTGPYVHHVNQNNSLFFLEPSISYQWDISERLSLLPLFRISFILSEFKDSAFPVYAAPGIGWLQFANDDQLGANRIVGGYIVRLIYRFFK